MHGVLPDAVLRRPKTPLAARPEMQVLRHPESRWVDSFVAAQGLARYVDRAKVPPVWVEGQTGEASEERRWRDLRPLSLSVWLRNLEAEGPRKANTLPESPGAGAPMMKLTTP